ncbi:MAG TPA: hypothetical protein VIX59_07360 [Candidatus Binataceae bacterium]|jgi:hypothetical protein
MDYIETLDNAGDTLIEGIKTVQNFTVAAAERVGSMVSGLIPNTTMPLPVNLPEPREFAEMSFRFWQRLAENQKEFTLKLIDAFQPTTKSAKSAHKAAA